MRGQAQLYGYVKVDSAPARGIINYFMMLTDQRQTWLDTRPDYLIALSTRTLDATLDHTRRKHAERTAAYLFDPSLPQATNPSRAPGTRHAVWWDTEIHSQQREQHSFIEASFPLDYFADLALAHGITDPRGVNFQLNRPQRASNALEAIGLTSLTPTFELFNPKPFTRERIRTRYFKEVEW